MVEIINKENIEKTEKKQNIFFRLFKLLIWILVIAIIIFYYQYSNFKTDNIVKENKIIEIKNKETIKDLAKKLNINYYFLKKYLKDNDEKFKLLKGKFKIKENSKINDILKSLKKPLPEKQIEITILEGWNIFDIDACLYNPKKYKCAYEYENNEKINIKIPLINKGDYIKYVQNSEKIKALTKFYKFINPDFISLEGYLYPDTYKIKSPLKINELVIKQLDNFEEKVYNKILKRKNLENKTIYNIVDLASIVEKEEKNLAEKPTVAGILKKRLQNNWNIGADITVCYPHKLTANECKMVVSKYINEKSEYNTRTMIGLPKTPIGNPSFETINATLNYKKTPYWFYLHNIKTGKIYYAKTNGEHEANKKYMY